MDRPSDDDARTTTAIGGRDEAVLVRRFWLRVVAGAQAGLVHASEAEPVVVGTHASANLVLTDETVSRFHAEIEVREGRALVRDLGSRNGTLVDGVSVREAWLHDGARITLGSAELSFQLRQESAKIVVSDRESFGLMFGKSIATRRAFALLDRAAASDATVLLEGETGTGKELAADSIHRESARRDKPFVIVDCGMLPAELLESELFGHERGAFTGAALPREGAFEAANGGTIFLDEIGELSPELQPKLLRVLESRHVKRLGSNRYVDVDVRVVAATNKNLRVEVNERRFRADLYFRLAVLEIRLPPLRERSEDLPGLVEHLIARMGKENDPHAADLRAPEFLKALARHRWTGNVRELRNYVERCLALREQVPLQALGDEPPLPDPTQPLKVARERWTRVLENRYASAVLAANDDNVTAAARAAGVDRMYFHRMLQRYGLR